MKTRLLFPFIIIYCAITATSCANQQLRPNSPEEHTKNFTEALLENPFK